MNTHKAVILPTPEKLALRNFTLYRRARSIEIQFNKAVFCLAGANGLGKSTFLASLNYAITGTVAKPGVNFLGASKFYEDISGYSNTYFNGRIDAADHDVAEVEIAFSVGDHRFSLVRGMFAPTALRALYIEMPSGEVLDFSDQGMTDAERHGRYVHELLKATGLTSFAQLVFLQWFIFTFDEQRHLLFWSDRVTEQAMFLAFGYSSESAERAEALQRAYDSADSKARNLQWQATGVRKRLEALESALGNAEVEDVDEVVDEHSALLVKLEQAGYSHERLLASVRDAQLQLDEQGARESAARVAYEEAFARRISTASTASGHPVIIETLNQEQCAVCGSRSHDVRLAIEARLRNEVCPLCEVPLASSTSTEEARALESRLEELGHEVVSSGETVAALRNHLSRQIRALDLADAEIREARLQLETFRSANTRALLSASSEGSLVGDAQSGLRKEISDLLRQKDQALGKRDSAKVALDQLRKDLGHRFTQMEDEFVPLLQDLAYEFLGVPLQVDLERRGHHLGLALNFHGSHRASPDALSESQRFFLDIALRMALVRKLSTTHAPATLYIDTPEGSLDIAYEKRAGRMFARFASGEDRIVMTANINTSKLLLELAQACGNSRMDLIRMTEWSDLTSVQQDAHEEFEQAFNEIETRLSDHNA